MQCSFLALAAARQRPSSFAAPSSRSGPGAEQRPRDLLNRLFGCQARLSYRDRAADVAQAQASNGLSRNSAEPGRSRARSRGEGAEPPQVAVVTKRPDARVVLVVGDFLAAVWPRA